MLVPYEDWYPIDNADCWSFLSFGFGLSNWMVLSLLMINPFNFMNHFWHLNNFMDNQKDKFVNTCGMWCGRSWFLSFIFSVLEQQAYSILVSAHLYNGLYMGKQFFFSNRLSIVIAAVIISASVVAGSTRYGSATDLDWFFQFYSFEMESMSCVAKTLSESGCWVSWQFKFIQSLLFWSYSPHFDLKM